MENRLLLKHLIEKLRMKHEIELWDAEGYRLFDCSSNSLALESYFDRKVVEWFASDNLKLVILIGDSEGEEK